MCKYKSYEVIHYRNRADGRIEYSGKEFLVLSDEEALDMSWSAIVVCLTEGFNGIKTFLFEGRHAQFDPHNGWVS